mgnify:FL=1
MKKTLAAVAVLGAFAGSALAADVQLYGIVDLGFNYTHIDGDLHNGIGYDDKDTFEMKSGQQSGSRFGFKGTEDLGNGLTVGFVLENGFSADTGADNATFFDRESMLFLQGGFGKVAFGRIGSFNQGQGSFSKIGMLTPFGTSWGDYVVQAGAIFASSTRYANSIVYETPSFAGFQVTAMYGMGDDGVENESGSDRYYGVAATYKNGPASAYLAVDSTNYKTAGVTNGQNIDDAWTVTLGGNWDFEVAKLYFGAQYFDEVKLSSLGGIAGKSPWTIKNAADEVTFSTANLKATGYSVTIGADAPLAGGKLMAAAAYVDGEQSDFEKDYGEGKYDFTRWVISAGYDYPLSKRTNVYGVMSYMDDEIERTGANKGTDWNPSAYTFMVGMRHKF